MATKRMAYLHWLLQIQVEVAKALNIYQDHSELVVLKNTVEKLQVTVVQTSDIEIVEDGMIEAEKANFWFGILKHIFSH